MTEAELSKLYGWSEIDTWRITYHAGRYGVDDGGVIKIA